MWLDENVIDQAAVFESRTFCLPITFAAAALD
jgi:hypothetical protein